MAQKVGKKRFAHLVKRNINCIFALVKKLYLWVLAAIMAITALALVGLQISYLWQAKQAREHDFEQTVKNAMRKVIHNVELREASDVLLQVVRDSCQAHRHTLSLNTSHGGQLALLSRGSEPYMGVVKLGHIELTEADKHTLRERYTAQHGLVEEAAAALLARSNTLHINERIDVNELDYELQQAFAAMGVDLKFHLRLYDGRGDELFRCPDYEEQGQEHAFRQDFFTNASSEHRGVLVVHFPEYEQYLYQNAQYSLVTLILCVIFVLSFGGCIYYALNERRLSEMKRDFVSNMTHELKTPVATIDLAVQMLSEPGMLQIDRIVQKNMAIIRSEAQRLRFLIDKVLELSLYEQGQRLFNKQPLDLNRLVREAVGTFEVQNKALQGSIELRIEAKKATIRADRTHLTNIVFNLLDNAIKYRKPEEEPHFIVRTWNEYDLFCLAITDNGIGIKAKDLKHIFETYYRVSTKNRHDVKGFGLGLAYVKKIVAAHNATIEVASTFGVGTTFTVKFPLLLDPVDKVLPSTTEV